MDLFNDGRRHGYIKTIFGERKRFRIAFAILDRVIETFLSRKNVAIKLFLEKFKDAYLEQRTWASDPRSQSSTGVETNCGASVRVCWAAEKTAIAWKLVPLAGDELGG